MTTQTAPARPAPAPSRNGTADPGPLLAAHTANFPALLRQLGASLLVTTYQAGKLVMVRDEGDHLNTHYRAFLSPMGLALADGGSRLAMGTTVQVWEFRDVPSVARRLGPAGRHDACFLPRQSHVTGNVLIHEMAYGHPPLSPAGRGAGASPPCPPCCGWPGRWACRSSGSPRAWRIRRGTRQGRWSGTVFVRPFRFLPGTQPLEGGKPSRLHSGRSHFYGDPELPERVEALVRE